MKPLYLRYRHLVALGACEEREAFQERFGSKVLVTVTTAVANAAHFNWWWIAEAGLTTDRYVNMRDRVRALFEADTCDCPTCDPDQARRKFVARCFAEALLDQGGLLIRGKIGE